MMPNLEKKARLLLTFYKKIGITDVKFIDKIREEFVKIYPQIAELVDEIMGES